MTLIAGLGNTKKFERPDGGIFHAVLADIVDLGMVKNTYQGVETEKPMIRFIWILDKNGKDGKPLSIAKRYNLVLHEKSNLYKDLKMILNAAPSIPYDTEQLIGIVRKLFIVRADNPQDPANPYANINGILPADSGATVAIPSDFVRVKNKFKTQAGPQGQSVQTFATPQTAAQMQPAQAAPPAAQGPDVSF